MVVLCGPGQPIVFNHIPRTAGSAFVAALTQALRPQHAFVGFDRSTFGPFEGFEQLAPDRRQGLVLEPTDIPAYADVVMGHLSPSTTRARFSQSRHLTLLREPRTRIVSHWLSWRAQSNLTMRGWGDWAAYVRLARAPLDYVLDDPDAAFAMDNLITRSLVWPHPLTPADNFIDYRSDAELIETARATLTAYGFAGVIEDRLVAERASHFLGAELRMGRRNEAPLSRRQASLDIADECIKAGELLAERSRLDALLWDRVATDTYLPPAAVERERNSLYASAVEDYDLSAAEGLRKRRDRRRTPPPGTQPPVLSR